MVVIVELDAVVLVVVVLVVEFVVFDTVTFEAGVEFVDTVPFVEFVLLIKVPLG